MGRRRRGRRSGRQRDGADDARQGDLLAAVAGDRGGGVEEDARSDREARAEGPAPAEGAGSEGLRRPEDANDEAPVSADETVNEGPGPEAEGPERADEARTGARGAGEEPGGSWEKDDDEEEPPRGRAPDPKRSVYFELVADDRPETANPPPAGERLTRAKELVQDGRVEDALALYRSILGDNPSSLKARNNLGALYEALGKHELALEQFEAALTVGPDNVEVLSNLGSVLGVLGRFEEAEAHVRRAARLAPDSLEVRATLGILFFRKGLYGQAEAELRQVCEQDAEHGNAFFYRGEALNRLGRYDEAMAALEHAITLQPRNGKAYYTLGILYDRKHLPVEASLMYRKAREYQ